jgi:hypothetical protein
MLALDSLLAFMASVEKLADWAVDQGGAVPAAAAKGMRSVERVQVDVCKALVEATWRGMLAAVSQLLLRSSREEIVLQLLKVCWRREEILRTECCLLVGWRPACVGRCAASQAAAPGTDADALPEDPGAAGAPGTRIRHLTSRLAAGCRVTKASHRPAAPCPCWSRETHS